MKQKLVSLLKSFQEYLLIKRSGLFDISYYQRSYSSLIKKRVNPIWHYVVEGWKEGKNPSPEFDTVYYLRENKDIRNEKINPLIHYIQFGQAEDRPPNLPQDKNPFSYQSWIDQYDTLEPSDTNLIKSHINALTYKPLISILLPIYLPNELFLKKALDSLKAQYYSNWECCITADNSLETSIRNTLDDYAKRDARIKVLYGEFHGQTSTTYNTALSMASGTFLGLLNQNDELREHTLYLVINEINQHPQVQLIYSDEDLIDEFSIRYDPYFKPDWNPDLFCTQNLVAHFLVLKTDRVNQIGGFHTGYNGAQDWALAMRISEIIPASRIRHIPYILYHLRAALGQTTISPFSIPYTKEMQLKLLFSHFERMNRPVEISHIRSKCLKVSYKISGLKPMASIIIPTRNQLKHLKICLESIREHTEYPHYEILIVDNQSDDEETLEYLRNIDKEEDITLLKYDYPFNYSAINNYAVKHAKGEVLVFLNNDIEVITSGWLYEMLGLAIRPETGAVGAMLYYPNDTIQHAGIILGMRGVAGHIYYGSPRGTHGQKFRVLQTQNFSAVTGACMVVGRDRFLNTSGFNETELGIAYNDIDLCIRLMKAGFMNVWTPHAEFYHYESLSRESDDTPENKSRFNSEIEYIKKQWAELLTNDPAYNPNLSLTSPDFSLAFPPRVERPWIK